MNVIVIDICRMLLSGARGSDNWKSNPENVDLIDNSSAH